MSFRGAIELLSGFGEIPLGDRRKRWIARSCTEWSVRADLHSTRMIACGVTQIQSTLFTSFLPSLYVISP